MKLSASIQLAWQLAGAEAATGEFKEIQAEHLCLGLLKLADLPRQPVEKLGDRAATVRAVLSEIGKLREVLKGQGIDGTATRRELRRALGKGGCPFQGGVLHRAPACRALFDAAVREASGVGLETLTSVHLLEAILRAPPPVLAQVLGGITRVARPRNGVRPTDKLRTPTIARRGHSTRRSTTRLLDRHGEDLKHLPLQSHPGPPLSRTAEAKVLLEALNHRSAVLLVCAWEQTALAVLLAAADALERQGRRIIVLSRAGAAGNLKGRENWERIFAEAEGAKDIILYMPLNTVGAASGKVRSEEADWAEFLRDAAEQRTVPFICQASPEVFESHLRKHPAWKRHAQVIWLHDTKLKSVPREL